MTRHRSDTQAELLVRSVGRPVLTPDLQPRFGNLDREPSTVSTLIPPVPKQREQIPFITRSRAPNPCAAKLDGEGAPGRSSHDPVIAPLCPWGGDELMALRFPSPLRVRCFVMRQEEWEQVIQGLRARGERGRAWELGVPGVREQGSQAGSSPLLFPQELRGGGGSGAVCQALQHGHRARWGEPWTLPLPARCGRAAEQSAGRNYHQGWKRQAGVRTGDIGVRLGDLAWMGLTETPRHGFCSMKASVRCLGPWDGTLAVGVPLTVIFPA